MKNDPTSFWGSRRATILAGAMIVLVTLAAYHNSFSGPFIFDDRPSILENLTIEHLWPVTTPLSPPQGEGLTVSGRPLLNLSFALNHAISGTSVWSYHALNLVIHVLAGLVLFGIVRRTLLQPGLRGRYGDLAVPLALAIAALWTLHPLQTESVTYVVQRAESMMGLCYLLTLYCFIRGTESSAPGLWPGLAVVACLAGMATKEVMVSAPLVVWLYDRTFVSGGFAAAWRRHRWFHLGLAATWLLLGYLVITTGNRGETAGFGTEISWWAYALTQCRAIAHYLWLTVCPYPLVLDYGTETVGNVSAVLLPALVLGLLLTGVLIALRRRSVVGFLGVWFFAILAPSSSVLPVATQTMAEHRMYLPLAAVIVLIVLAIRFLAGRACLIVFLALAAGLGWLTERRNRDYHSELAIWSDTAAKQPANARAHCSLGTVFAHAGRLTDAASRFTEALRLDPQNAEAHSGLGAVFTQQGRLSEALVHYEAALRINPDDAVAHNDLGNALIGFSRFPEAITHCTEAIRLNPRDAKAHYNLGYALLKSGRMKEAIDHLEAAIRLKLDSADAHYNLGNALVQAGRTPEAVGQYEQAVRLAPTLVEARGNLANALLQTGRIAEAVTQYKQALRLKPGDADVRFNLAVALRKLGRTAEAYRELLEVLRLKPDDAEAREELARLTASP